MSLTLEKICCYAFTMCAAVAGSLCLFVCSFCVSFAFFNKAKTSHKSGASDTEESGYIFTKSKPIPSLFSFSFSFGFDFLSLSSLIFSHSLFFDIGPRKDIGKK